MSGALDTNHRWVVWCDPGSGDPYPVDAFDDRLDASICAASSSQLSVREHLAWLPTATVRVRRAGIAIRVGQMYPSEGEILVGPEPVGRGMVVEVSEDEFLVAVPVLPPARGSGPSIWELGSALERVPA